MPLPPTDPAPVLDRLLDERIVPLFGELDDEAAHRAVAQLLLLAADDPARDITLLVHSPGGPITAGTAVHDAMGLVRPDVATWAVGIAAGTAQFVVSAGTPGKRHALPHARLVLSTPRPGGRPLPGADVFAAMKREVAELTARHTGQPVEAVVADAERDRWFDAGQARAYGLVDHVTADGGPDGAGRSGRPIGFLTPDRGNPRR
jgi:ATP-dependent Clp protease, protease subunit